MTVTRQKTRELTGKHVLLWFLGFFALIFAVNGVLVKAATSTFGGVETSSSYKAGLLFKQDIAAAEQQDALHWRIDGRIARNAGGAAVLDISARNDGGMPLTALTATARLAHPADERLDHLVTLGRVGPGQFHGETQANAGQWELIIDLYRDDVRMFRSRSRVTLR
jgi:nitrogen fixation protein FixH